LEDNNDIIIILSAHTTYIHVCNIANNNNNYISSLLGWW